MQNNLLSSRPPKKTPKRYPNNKFFCAAWGQRAVSERGQVWEGEKKKGEPKTKFRFTLLIIVYCFVFIPL